MDNKNFENLIFSDGYGWEGKVTIDLFGKDIEVDLTIYSDEEEITDIQYQSYEKFKEKWSELQNKIAERIIKYYQDVERFSYGPDDDEEEFNKWWPEINTIEEVIKQIELDGIVITNASIMEDVFGGRCIGLIFSKKWGNDTEKNGIGLQLVNEEIKDIGFMDIVL